MFETWKRKRRIRNELRGAYGTAFESPDLHERIRAAQHALRLAKHPDLNPWPFSLVVPRRRAIGKLHATMGRSYLQLRNENPRQFTRLGMQETQLATQILNDSDGVEWAMALTDLSVAYADSIEGARADNLERAIEVGEAALKAIDRRRHLMPWMAVAGNLAQYYAERRRDSRDGNLEKAISLLESVLAEATKHATPFQRAPVLLDLGTMYARRRRFGKDENVERAIAASKRGWRRSPSKWIRRDGPWGSSIYRRCTRSAWMEPKARTFADRFAPTTQLWKSSSGSATGNDGRGHR